MDREDKFVYDQELVEILRFGLYLQIHYFKLGNERIVQEADNEEQVKDILKSNQQTIISNFNNYLDYINKERSFSKEALSTYTSAIDEYFSQLIETFPDGNYNPMISKAVDMEKKATDLGLKNALTILISKLKAKMETGANP